MTKEVINELSLLSADNFDKTAGKACNNVFTGMSLDELYKNREVVHHIVDLVWKHNRTPADPIAYSLMRTDDPFRYKETDDTLFGKYNALLYTYKYIGAVNLYYQQELKKLRYKYKDMSLAVAYNSSDFELDYLNTLEYIAHSSDDVRNLCAQYTFTGYIDEYYEDRAETLLLSHTQGIYLDYDGDSSAPYDAYLNTLSFLGLGEQLVAFSDLTELKYTIQALLPNHDVDIHTNMKQLLIKDYDDTARDILKEHGYKYKSSYGTKYMLGSDSYGKSIGFECTADAYKLTLHLGITDNHIITDKDEKIVVWIPKILISTSFKYLETIGVSGYVRASGTVVMPYIKRGKTKQELHND